MITGLRVCNRTRSGPAGGDKKSTGIAVANGPPAVPWRSSAVPAGIGWLGPVQAYARLVSASGLTRQHAD
jgi:hypothetical protein